MKYIFLLVILLLFTATSISCEAYSYKINNRKGNIKRVLISIAISFVSTYITLHLEIVAIRHYGIDDLPTILVIVILNVVLVIILLVSYLIK